MSDVCNEPLVPHVAKVISVRTDTNDVKTFGVVGLDGGIMFDHRPGQCAMLSIPGVGEALFSITSSPTNTKFKEFSIKRCGVVTEAIHQLEVGDEITCSWTIWSSFPR